MSPYAPAGPRERLGVTPRRLATLFGLSTLPLIALPAAHADFDDLVSDAISDAAEQVAAVTVPLPAVASGFDDVSHALDVASIPIHVSGTYPVADISIGNSSSISVALDSSTNGLFVPIESLGNASPEFSIVGSVLELASLLQIPGIPAWLDPIVKSASFADGIIGAITQFGLPTGIASTNFGDDDLPNFLYLTFQAPVNFGADSGARILPTDYGLYINYVGSSGNIVTEPTDVHAVLTALPPNDFISESGLKYLLNTDLVSSIIGIIPGAKLLVVDYLADYPMSLGDYLHGNADGVLGFGLSAPGPGPNVVAQLPGHLGDGITLIESYGFAQFGRDPLNPYGTLFGEEGSAPYSDAFVRINGGDAEAVRLLLNTTGESGTVPNTLLTGGAPGDSVPPGTHVSVYRSDGVFLYDYYTGYGSSSPTITSATSSSGTPLMDSGFWPFKDKAVFLATRTSDGLGGQ
ncbi:hypothetical protein NM962_09180 [Mycobacterium sp. SVM_VP21]|nr:hypothetical protein NM962_09180 [Mycobacterium sp. SVM_VP21]